MRRPTSRCTGRQQQSLVSFAVRYYVLKKRVIFGKLLRKGKTRKELTMSGKKRNSKATNTQVQLYLSFELGEQDWTLGFTIGLGQEPRKRKIAARDLKALEQEIARAKQRFGLPDTALVQSCYEAGRDGFWLHRDLTAHHIENLVVDSSSIEVNRREGGTRSQSLSRCGPTTHRFTFCDNGSFH
jgi:hypothetical protein